jgi:hypothetical protein
MGNGFFAQSYMRERKLQRSRLRPRDIAITFSSYGLKYLSNIIILIDNRECINKISTRS